MPNTKIQLSSALIGAIFAGTLYQLLQWAYLFSQIGVSKFNAIYGSFAAFPLFLIWLQASWIIVLYGAEIVYAHQNQSTYEFEPEYRHASHHLKTVAAILLTAECTKKFQEQKPPPTGLALSKSFELPVCLIREVLQLLVEAKVLSITHAGNPENPEVAYQPGRPLEQLTLKGITESLNRRGVNRLSLQETPEMERCRLALERLLERLEHLPENIRAQDVLTYPYDSNLEPLQAQALRSAANS